MAPTAKKYGWEINPKTNKLERKLKSQMKGESVEDFQVRMNPAFKQLQASQMVLKAAEARNMADMSKGERERAARRRAAAKKRSSRRRVRLEAERQKRRLVNMNPWERTLHHRRQLRDNVARNVRGCDNMVVGMREGSKHICKSTGKLGDAVQKFGTIFGEMTKSRDDLSQKVASMRASLDRRYAEYETLKKQKKRLMFNALADKARRVLARRRRAKEREEQQEKEERERSRSRQRDEHHLEVEDMDSDEVLALMAETEAHACLAFLLNDHLSTPQHTTQVEQKLRIGDCISGFLGEDNTIAAAANDIIQAGVEAFCFASAKKNMLQSADTELEREWAKMAGADDLSDPNEFAGYTLEDASDMEPDMQTRYFAWMRWQQKEKERSLAKEIARIDAQKTDVIATGTKAAYSKWLSDWLNASKNGRMQNDNEFSTLDSDMSDDDLFSTLMDFC